MRRALLGLLVLLLAACGVNAAGPVTDKEHTPGHYETELEPVYGNVCGYKYDWEGNYTYRCEYKVSHYAPVERWHDDRYQVQVHDESTDDRVWVDVSESEYDSLEIGDHFDNEED